MLSSQCPISTSEKTDELWKAISQFKEEVFGFEATTENPALKKSGKIYKYAPLPEMQDVLNRKMPRHGLIFTAGPLDSGVMYGIRHIDSNQFEYRWAKMPPIDDVNKYKGYNTAIVRYGLGLMLCLPTDEDLDNADITHPDIMKKPVIKNEEDKPWLNILNKDGSVNKTNFDNFKKTYTGEKNIESINKIYNLSKQTADYLETILRK